MKMVNRLLSNAFQKEDDPLFHVATRDYINHMSCNGTFADECVIRMISRCLEKDIFIVSSSESTDYMWTLINANINGSVGSPFLLGHLGELHYVSLGKININRNNKGYEI